MEIEQLLWEADPQCTSSFSVDYACVLGKVFKVTHENGEKCSFKVLSEGTLEINRWRSSIFNILEQIHIFCQSFIFIRLENLSSVFKLRG